MATANTKAAATATAGKAAPAPAAVVAAPAAAPQAPLFTCYSFNAGAGNGWPVKAQGGNTVRAYCYAIALQLAKAQPKGFTLAQYAAALAANAAASTMRQPGSGWGTAEKPNGIARQHAAWFAATAQAWLVPMAAAPAAPAPAAKG